MPGLDLAAVRDYLRQFAADRDWEQFHTPKNLSMALAGEAAELMEIFQWMTPDDSSNLSGDQVAAASDELADVLQYVVRLADRLDIDLESAVWEKLQRNAERYPADEVRGSSEKR